MDGEFRLSYVSPLGSHKVELGRMSILSDFDFDWRPIEKPCPLCEDPLHQLATPMAACPARIGILKGTVAWTSPVPETATVFKCKTCDVSFVSLEA